MPNGKRLKQYLPNGVRNVVSDLDSGAKGIRQKPELASNFEKTVAPATRAKVWSTAGRMCLSRWTLWFSLVRSTQMRTFPPDLGTTTMPAHHSVSSSIRETTPNRSILSILAFTFDINGIAILRGTLIAYSSAPSCNVIRYSAEVFLKR